MTAATLIKTDAQRLVEDYLDQMGRPKVPVLTAGEKARKEAAIEAELKRQNAVLVCHYYCDADLQRLAERSGGIVSDSLEMARFGRDHQATTLVVAGVRFMGETAKILSPEKTVLMPSLLANCSLDIGCPADQFAAFCDAHPYHTVVVYANTSAAVKARADWVVTSSCAVNIVTHLTREGQKIIWAPDKHLGTFIRGKTGANMLLWDGACIVHEEFRARGVRKLKAMYPDAAVLVHPESPADVIELADAVGSTSQLIKAARELPHKRLIVTTEQGIFYKMQQAAPDKELIIAPTAGEGATCRSCAHCPWMAMNDLTGVLRVLQRRDQIIDVDRELGRKAMKPLNRMLEFTSARII